MPLFGRGKKPPQTTIPLPFVRQGGGDARVPGHLGDLASRQLPSDFEFYADRYSGGTSAHHQRSLYPVLGTAAGIHNLQVLQLMVTGLDTECYSDVRMPDGSKERLCVETERLIECPCPWDETQDFGFISAQMVAAFALEQEVFIFKHLTKGGIVEGIEVLPNHHVRRENYGGIPIFNVEAESLESSRIRSGLYTQREILHIVYAPAIGYPRGLGAPAMARSAVLQGLMTDLFSVSYFKNALALAGVMMLKGKTPEQIKEIEKDVAAKFSGVENSNKWMMLSAEDAKVEQLAATPSNANLVQAQQRAAIDSGKLLWVPPTQAGESIVGTLSYAVSAAQDVQMTKNTIQPWGETTARGFNRKSQTPIFSFGVKMRYVFDDLLRGDERSRAEMVGKLVKNMVISINQANRMMRYPTYEGEEFEKPLKPTSWGNVDEEPPEPQMPMMPTGDGEDEDDDEGSGEMNEEQMSAAIADALSQIFGPSNAAIGANNGI